MIWPFFRHKVRRAPRIAIEPPEPAADRHGIALVLIAKNEEPRIRDWLTFHALAGVTEVIVYDNLSSDRTAEIARNFPGLPVTVVPWQLYGELEKPRIIVPQQMLAYCHAIETFGGRFRWMAMIDTDEFIVPKEHKTVLEALTELEEFSNISLPWTMFGHNGHSQPQSEPVPFAYTARARHAQGPLLNFKCIVDPVDVTHVSVHKFGTRSMGQLSANTRGDVAARKQRTIPRFVTTDVLQLNHYYLMSRQEMEAKINGSDIASVAVDQRARAIKVKRDLIEADTVEDTCAIEFLSKHGIADGKSLRARY